MLWLLEQRYLVQGTTRLDQNQHRKVSKLVPAGIEPGPSSPTVQNVGPPRSLIQNDVEPSFTKFILNNTLQMDQTR